MSIIFINSKLLGAIKSLMKVLKGMHCAVVLTAQGIQGYHRGGPQAVTTKKTHFPQEGDNAQPEQDTEATELSPS